ncbi:MAG: CPBP family intramembrane metalloprotease, partial [Porphyrobacter sp.]|nr:CPBP family intramembrane metalloprotease [Porphyrobacter sp.]
FDYKNADFASSDVPTTIFLISNTVLFAPIAEEIFFRSHVIAALEKFKANNSIVLLSGLLSSSLWSLSHYEDGLYFLFSTFLIGNALFFIRYKTKSIVNCIALHSASNSLGLAIMHIGS